MGGGSINNSSTSTEYVSAKALNDILSAMFPIGYVLTTFDTADYTNYMGYTWERLQNTFLYADGTWSVGDVGGEVECTLTVDKIPSHRHEKLYYADSGRTFGLAQTGTSPNSSWYIDYAGTSDAPGDAFNTGYSGGNQPHNNMPPYTVVRMWRRVS